MSKHLSEPFFTLMSMRLKTVEGRLGNKDYKVKQIITWHNDDFGHRSFQTQITEIKRYDSFRDYLETEGIVRCLPGFETIEEGLNVYYSFFTREDEQEHGVIALELLKL